MKIRQIEYRKTISENFNNLSVGVIVELDDDDSEVEVLNRARDFVERQTKGNLIPEWEIQEARRTLSAVKAISHEKLDSAADLIKKIEEMDFPF